MIHSKTRPHWRLFLAVLIAVFLFAPSKSGAMVNDWNLTGFGGHGFEFNEHNQAIPIYGLSSTYFFKDSFDFGAELAMRGPIYTLGIDFN